MSLIPTNTKALLFCANAYQNHAKDDIASRNQKSNNQIVMVHSDLNKSQSAFTLLSFFKALT